MSYIGNNPDVNAFTVSVERFNGTGSCTQFQLERTNYNDNASIEVVISGAQQDPTANYGVENGLITFTSAPPVGSNNIVVTYRAPVVVTFNQVTSSQLQANSVTSTAIAPSAVTTSKIAQNSITGDKIQPNQISGNLLQSVSVSGDKIQTNQISGNLLQSGSVSGNNIVDNSIRGNNIVAGQLTGNLFSENQISGNLLQSGSVSGNNIVINSIRANNIVAGEIKGNLIGTGAISSNHFVGGGVTSDVLSSDLTISTRRVAETVNVVTTSVSGNYNIFAASSSVYYFTSNAAGSITFNLVANTTHTFDQMLSVGQTCSLAIALKQGSTRYRANVFIDGVNPLSSVFWLGASQPAQLTSQSQSIDSYSITVIKTGSATYTVMVGNTAYGYANNQGMGPGGAQ